MIKLHFECDIKANAERVFGLLADLRDYDRWLPSSSAFKGTHRISEGPIGVGTTYVEPGPFGARHGARSRNSHHRSDSRSSNRCRSSQRHSASSASSSSIR